MHKLCEVVDDEELDGKNIWFIVYLRGLKSADKKAVLNAALVVYVQNIRKVGFLPGSEDADSVMQPNTILKELKHIFKCMADSSIHYQQNKFKGYAGSYQAVVTKLVQETVERKYSFQFVFSTF